MQALLQHHLRPGLPHEFAGKHVAGDRAGFFFCLGNHDPLAGGESICLHNDGGAEQTQGVLYLGGIAADGVVRCRDMHTLHEFLGKGLACLKVRCFLRRAKDCESAAFKLIYDAEGERKFGADNGQIGV